MESLIVLAAIMALFGVLGYQRGTRSSLFTAAVIWLSLLVMTRLGGKVTSLINGIAFGVRFILSGGLQALGSGGDRGEAVNRVFQGMGNVKPLVTEGSASMALVFILLAVTAVLLGQLAWFKGRHSLSGLVLGLFAGYIVSGYLVWTLLPEADIQLPLAFGLGHDLALRGDTSLAGRPSVSDTLRDKVALAVTERLDQRALAFLLVIAIAVFVVVAVRRTHRTTKK